MIDSDDQAALKREFEEREQERISQLIAENIRMRGALEVIKDWSWSDEQVNPIKYIAREALSQDPSEALAAVRGAIKKLADNAAHFEHMGQLIQADKTDKIISALKKAFGETCA